MLYKDVIDSMKEKMEKTLNHFQDEILSLRTGRASSALVENIAVDCYGQKMTVSQVASISIQPPNTILVSPWDKSLIPVIEAGIRNSQLGISPVSDNDFIRINIPALTQERKEQLIKLLNQKAEDARIAIRQEREKAIKEIDSMQKEGTITEDDKFRAREEVQKVVDDYNQKIKELRDKKEKEILE